MNGDREIKVIKTGQGIIVRFLEEDGPRKFERLGDFPIPRGVSLDEVRTFLDGLNQAERFGFSTEEILKKIEESECS